MSTEHEEDSCRLLNEDGTPIFIDELINAHGYNMEQHSAASHAIIVFRFITQFIHDS